MSKEGGEGDGKGGERQLQRGGGQLQRESGGWGGRVREMGQTGSEEEERKE